MRYLKLTLAYDGTNYAGWQVQPNGVTVQEVLERAWHSVTSETIRVTASGRTDSGVHALGQVCNLATETTIDCDSLVRALNTSSPEDICVFQIAEVDEGFHAIYDARQKHYRYEIQIGQHVDVFRRAYCWHIRKLPAIDAMKLAAGDLVGTHDFASFQAAGSERVSTVRTISRLDIEHSSYDRHQNLRIDICADGFLYNMVRNIVGTLVEIGMKRRSPEWITEVIARYDRAAAGPTAPPQGLFLVGVEY